MKHRHNDSLSALLRFLVYAAAIFTFGILAFLLFYMLIQGVPNISWDLFAWTYSSENASVIPAVINTLIITLLSLILAIPFGVGAAIYLVEYASKSNRVVNLIRLATETLSGIPSIVYGLFGYLLFVVNWGLGYSIIAGALTLTIMILPLILRTTEEALKSVPLSYRQGSFGLGAGRLRTIGKIILPAAMPGILAGVILAIGRIVGETAALIYTSGSASQIAGDLLQSGRTLSVHMYALWNEGIYTDKAYATAVILLITVLIINSISAFIARKVSGHNI